MLLLTWSTYLVTSGVTYALRRPVENLGHLINYYLNECEHLIIMVIGDFVTRVQELPRVLSWTSTF